MSEQGTEQWFADRLGKATGSRFGDVMARGRGSAEAAARKNYRAELVVERLTGQRAEGYKSSAMEWGTNTEPLARLYYSIKTGIVAQEFGFIKHDTIEAGISPDGLIKDDGGLEIKCPNTATHIEALRNQKVPSIYYWQVVGGMWITGRKWWDFVSFDPRLPENARMIIIRVQRNEDEIAKLEAGVIEFLATVDDELQFVSNYGQEATDGKQNA